MHGVGATRMNQEAIQSSSAVRAKAACIPPLAHDVFPPHSPPPAPDAISYLNFGFAGFGHRGGLPVLA